MVRVWHWSVAVCHELNRANRGVAVVFDYYTTPLRVASDGRALPGVAEGVAESPLEDAGYPEGFCGSVCNTVAFTPRARAENPIRLCHPLNLNPHCQK